MISLFADALLYPHTPRNDIEKSMDGIDFQENLSRGSLFWEGDS
jgi:hypothetical protein